ncbi:MAG: transaldolase, partial [Actinobacteria bacterium]|nr:transaldolase [Actinomycetota bacterium]
GATGATSNPVIVLGCIKADPERWAKEISEIRKRKKNFSEIDIAWELIKQLAIEALPILRPVYDKTNGRNGRVTVQVNPKYFTNPEKMIEHAKEISLWGENIAIKIPAVEAGFIAMEELTACGLTVLSTVQFTVSQAIATAEAFRRGYKRAEADGIDISRMNSWAAIMVGRLDDHLRDEQKENNIPVNTEDIHYASLAVFKKIARIFEERGYRCKPMAAAIRGSYHCMSFVGGNVVVTLPPKWQVFVNGSAETIVTDAIERPEPENKIMKLQKHFPDFNRAYEENGMKVEDFVKFGSSRKTLRQFIYGYEELLGFVRKCML